MNNVIWKDIEGYEGLYQINNLGAVKSLQGWNGQKHIKREKILKARIQSINQNYKRIKVDLKKDGKKKGHTIHRLIAKAFIPNPHNKPYINHINSNPLDNRIENLEWCTQRENVVHSYDLGNRKSFKPNKLLQEYIISNYEYGIPISAIAKNICVNKHILYNFIKMQNVKKPNKIKRKYDIDYAKFKNMVLEGKKNKEIAKYFNCPDSLVAAIKYQKKRGIQ